MRRIIAWLDWSRLAVFQAGFIIFGTSWFFAPHFNTVLSSRTSYISYYEVVGQSYGWLFRIGDIVAAVGLIVAGIYLYRRCHRCHDRLKRFVAIVVIVIAGFMLIDPIATTNCLVVAGDCVRVAGRLTFVHDLESGLLTISLFGLSAYLAVKRRLLPATMWMIAQLIIGIGLVSGLVAYFRIQTVVYYIYQSLCMVWLAWLIGWLAGKRRLSTVQTGLAIRRVFSLVLFISGIFTIIASLAHSELFGRIRSLYIAGNTAWLSQHGIVIGVAMLYLSRHLRRGEYRARMIVLVLLYIEIIKYAVILPRPLLLVSYEILFVLLFVAAPYFSRGVDAISWKYRLQEAGLIIAGVSVALVTTILIFLRNMHGRRLLGDATSHFSRYFYSHEAVPRHLLQSAVLVHSLAVLGVTLILFLLWSFFRPVHARPDQVMRTKPAGRVAALLQTAAHSSEDYFKLVPSDKQYEWAADGRAFIAYKATRSVVFGLADPIGQTRSDQTELLASFTADWQNRGYRVCFLPVRTASLPLYSQPAFAQLQIGSSAIIDVHRFISTTVRNKWWRWQTNRNLKAGYDYQVSAGPHSADLLRQLRDVSDAWLAQDGRHEQAFALGYFDETYLQACQLHYLIDDQAKVIAFTNQLPVYNDLRQTTIDLMRSLPDNSGAMPYLLSRVIHTVATEQKYDFFDLGFVPLADMDGKLALLAKTLASRRFSAAGLAQFKNKFEPDWQPIYAVHDGDIADLAVIATNFESVMRMPNIGDVINNE